MERRGAGGTDGPSREGNALSPCPHASSAFPVHHPLSLRIAPCPYASPPVPTHRPLSLRIAPCPYASSHVPTHRPLSLRIAPCPYASSHVPTHRHMSSCITMLHWHQPLPPCISPCPDASPPCSHAAICAITVLMQQYTRLDLFDCSNNDTPRKYRKGFCNSSSVLILLLSKCLRRHGNLSFKVEETCGSKKEAMGQRVDC